MSSELRKLIFVLQKCLCELASQRRKSAALPASGAAPMSLWCALVPGNTWDRGWCPTASGQIQPHKQALINNRHLLLPSWTFLKGNSWSSCHKENKCPVKPPAQQIVNRSNIKGRYGTESPAPVFSFNNIPKHPTYFYMQNRKDTWIYMSTRI